MYSSKECACFFTSVLSGFFPIVILRAFFSRRSIPPRRLEPGTYAHFWFYDLSRVYVAITTIVLCAHASQYSTQSGESRVLLAHGGCHHREKFCRAS